MWCWVWLLQLQLLAWRSLQGTLESGVAGRGQSAEASSMACWHCM